MKSISELKYLRFAILLSFIIPTVSEPWVYAGDHHEVILLNEDIVNCNGLHTVPTHTYPLSYGKIISILNLNLEHSENLICKSFFNEQKKNIENTYNVKSLKIGIQSKADDMHFQRLGNRYYANDNLYIDFSNTYSNIAFRLKAARDVKEDRTYFDESYLSYKNKNQIYTFGRVSRWWSPSENISLILSNTARPAPGIEIKNYMPIIPKKAIFKIFKTVDYEFFINELEKNREISNALLFGNRVSLGITNNLDISLLRLAQFGGENRKVDLKTFANMFIGRDNTSANLSFQDQPGNQIAGIDWTYRLDSRFNTVFYGQVIGEDEAGYLPSRTIKLIGLSFKVNEVKISFDHADTFSGLKNYTYNHSLYKDGLRHYKMPIGASIDADSTKSLISLNKTFKNILYDFKISKIELNKNNSLKNYWVSQAHEFNQADFSLKWKYKKIKFDINFISRNKNIENYDRNSVFFRIEYKL